MAFMLAAAVVCTGVAAAFVVMMAAVYIWVVAERAEDKSLYRLIGTALYSAV